jgi:hypothetical protein
LPGVGTNRYAYAGQDPVNKSDANGHWFGWGGWSGGGGNKGGIAGDYLGKAAHQALRDGVYAGKELGKIGWEGVKAFTPVGSYYDGKAALAAAGKGNIKEAGWHAVMGLLGLAPGDGAVAKGGAKLGSKALEAGRFVPNPFGKLGGPLHQDKIKEVAKALENRVDRVVTEVKFDTPNGTKTSRFADVVGYKNDQIAEIAQVGKINQNGTPVAREVRAISDIENSVTGAGISVDFYGYNSFGGPR